MDLRKLKIKNDMIEYLPLYGTGTQKLLLFLFSKLEKNELVKNVTEGKGLELIVSKKEVFDLFDSVGADKKRRAFYNCKNILHDPIKIKLDNSYIETSLIAYTVEKRKNDKIIFYFPKHIVYCLADTTGHFFLLDFLILCRFKKKYSMFIYQILKKNKYNGKLRITPGEINNMLGINLAPGQIHEYFFKARKDFTLVGADLDFTLEIVKDWKKIQYFDFNIFDNKTAVEDTAKKEEIAVLKLYNSCLNTKQNNKYIIQEINKLTNYQTELLYWILRNKRKEIDKNIILKIEGVSTWIKWVWFYRCVCAAVLCIDYSIISKTVDNCAVEITKGKLTNKIAFVISRLNNLLKV